MNRIRKRSRRSERGLASVVVLVGLVVLMLMSGVILRQGASRREQARAQARRLQAEFLAESGLGRARARLAADSKYRGETWTIPSSALGTATDEAKSDRLDGVVTIMVENSNDQAKVREIRVQADYPRDPERRTRQTRRTSVEVESEPKKSTGANE